MNKVVILSGGGLKGAVAAGRYAPDSQLHFVYVDYGQSTARREVSAAEAIASSIPGAMFVALSMPHLLEVAGEGETPNARPSDTPPARRGTRVASPGFGLPAPMLRCVVPQLVLAGWQCASRIGAGVVALGLSRHWPGAALGLTDGDAGRDDRRELVYAMNLVLESVAGPPVRVEAPLADLIPGDIVRLGMRWGVPLGATWSCEMGGERPCQACAGCVTRAEAFRSANIADPAMRDKGGEAVAAGSHADQPLRR